MLARVRSNLAVADLFWAAAPRAKGAGAGRSSAGGARAEDPLAALEHAFAARFAYPHALLFPYARAALYALMRARAWREREILCPAYICAEVPYAVTASGNRVRFVDSAPDHFLPGPAQWRAATSPNTAMAIITPLFGYPVDKSAEASIRDTAPDAFLLYDESQSFGAADASGLQMRDADGALFSFGLGKMVTALSGGLLLLRDSAIFQTVRAYRDAHCRGPSLAHSIKRLAKGLAAWAAFREPALGVLDFAAHRLRLLPVDAADWTPTGGPGLPADSGIMPSAYQARLGLHQFAKLDLFLAARRRIAQHYERRLTQEGMRTFAHAHTPTWPRYPWPAAGRASVVAELRNQNVQVSLYLAYSCADLPAYRDSAQACPNAARWGRSMINLPNWHGMEIDQAEHVVGTLLRLNRKNPQAPAWPAAVEANSLT